MSIQKMAECPHSYFSGCASLKQALPSHIGNTEAAQQTDWDLY